MEDQTISGWGKSPASRKWHYFKAEDSFSICGKIGFYFGHRDPTNDNHSDNCAACKKKVMRIKKMRNKKMHPTEKSG